MAKSRSSKFDLLWIAGIFARQHLGMHIRPRQGKSIHIRWRIDAQTKQVFDSPDIPLDLIEVD
ncbi:hypothetical protein DKM19_36090 [Streptosporangium sp. 'caverna']|nr:hypothetical protein DKM19_36090 [Streptosporangium sp. 'caverna']